MKRWRIFRLAFLTVSALAFCVHVYNAANGIRVRQSLIHIVILGITCPYLLSKYDAGRTSKEKA